MLLLSCSIGKVRSLPVKSRSAGISRWKPSQSSVRKTRPSMPTLSRSRRQVASSRPPNSQARVRRATGSKARQSQTLFFPVHETPHLVDLHDLARRLARGLRRRLAGRAQPPVDRDVADARELGDHALAGVAHGVEQDRQGLHGLGFAALRRGGEVAAAGLAEVALVAPYRAVLDERRPGAPRPTLPSRSRGGTLISGRRSMGKCLFGRKRLAARLLGGEWVVELHMDFAVDEAAGVRRFHADLAWCIAHRLTLARSSLLRR